MKLWNDAVQPQVQNEMNFTTMKAHKVLIHSTR
jgi:hypothetical protein